MDIFKGTHNGRAYEVSEDGTLQIDKGPMLSEGEKETLRSVALGHFKHLKTRHGRFVRPQTDKSRS